MSVWDGIYSHARHSGTSTAVYLQTTLVLQKHSCDQTMLQLNLTKAVELGNTLKVRCIVEQQLCK